jgi:hypothetical protein
VAIRGDHIRMEKASDGVYVAYYSVGDVEGELMLTAEIEDGYSNSGSRSAVVSVRGASVLYLIEKNLVIAVPAILALVVGIVTFARNTFLRSKRDRLTRREAELVELQRKLQSQYLKEGNVDRKTFYDLSAKYDSELKIVRRQLGEGVSDE